MTHLEELFVSISHNLGYMVTPENLRTKMKDISAVRRISNKDRDFIMVEILAYLAKLENSK